MEKEFILHAISIVLTWVLFLQMLPARAAQTAAVGTAPEMPKEPAAGCRLEEPMRFSVGSRRTCAARIFAWRGEKTRGEPFYRPTS